MLSPSVPLIVARVADAVAHGLAVKRIPTPPHFPQFVANVLRRAEVSVSVVLGTLVYIDRATPYLRIAIPEWAHHRVFLGALIVASKYLNDSTLKNAHWAICTQLFGKRDIGRIEREFLEVLDFQLAIREEDLAKQTPFLLSVTSRRAPATRRHHRQLPIPSLGPDTSPSSSDSASPCTPTETPQWDIDPFPAHKSHQLSVGSEPLQL